MILDVDLQLKQIEWRIVADLTGDPVMIREIEAGQDQHAFTCVNLMELPLTKPNRTDAKIFNFRAIYIDPQVAPYAYYKDPKMPNFSKKKWETVCGGFFEKYAGMGATHREWIETVRRTGELIGPTGRRWVFEREPIRGLLDYNVQKIRNYPVQGSAGDLIKLALVYIHHKLKADYPKALLTMTVHDSIILDVPEPIVEEVAKICIGTFRRLPELALKHFGWKMKVPIDGEAEYGPSWGEMKEIKV